jgi:hypothetical protein
MIRQIYGGMTRELDLLLVDNGEKQLRRSYASWPSLEGDDRVPTFALMGNFTRVKRTQSLPIISGCEQQGGMLCYETHVRGGRITSELEFLHAPQCHLPGWGGPWFPKVPLPGFREAVPGADFAAMVAASPAFATAALAGPGHPAPAAAGPPTPLPAAQAGPAPAAAGPPTPLPAASPAFAAAALAGSGHPAPVAAGPPAPLPAAQAGPTLVAAWPPLHPAPPHQADLLHLPAPRHCDFADVPPGLWTGQLVARAARPNGPIRPNRWTHRHRAAGSEKLRLLLIQLIPLLENILESLQRDCGGTGSTDSSSSSS